MGEHGQVIGDALARLAGLPVPVAEPWLAGRSWDELARSGLRGVPALEAVIAGLGWLPLEARVRFRLPDGAGESGLAGVLHVSYLAPDAYDVGRPRRQKFAVSVPVLMIGDVGPVGWARWLLQVLSYLACHEVAEFFMVGGVRVFDPHAEGVRPVVDLPSHPLGLGPSGE